MGDDEADLVERIFRAAVSLVGDERDALVDRECGGDAELRGRVISRFRDHDADDANTLTLSSGGGSLDTTVPERIGSYRIIERVGEGGMGVVYHAEQDEPVKRRVALKVIKWGLDSKEVLARFELEYHALAVMNHSNIASIYDAGVTDRGLPYFVMEYVSGVPITEYCDREQLDTAKRLALFESVCDAVQHAHQKGVIHRDLKPSNILVAEQDGRPVAKVIDFGVAKSTEQGLTEETLHTELGRLVGTPAYMSPEQAETGSTDIDTRTDVYSLGVILYELLTGSLPVSADTIRGVSYSELQRIIQNVDPLRPSSRLSTTDEEASRLAGLRHTDTRSLARALRGDLDWITLKCLEKDRTRRYESAAELGRDVRRYLDKEPVLAGPASRAYRVSKFVRKHRVFVGATALVLAALTIGLGVSLWALDQEAKRSQELQLVSDFQASQLSGVDAERMAIQIRHGLLDRAKIAYERAKFTDDEVNDRLARLESLMAGADFTGLALSLLDQNVFARAADAIAKQFDGQPLVQGRLDQSLSDTLSAVGLIDRAEVSQRRSLVTFERQLGETHPETLHALFELGAILMRLGRFEDAEPVVRRAFEQQKALFGDDDRRTQKAYCGVGLLLIKQGKLEEAEVVCRDALERQRRALGRDDPLTLGSLATLGSLLVRRGKPNEAEPFLREALAGQRRVIGEENQETITTGNNLAVLLGELGKHEEAEASLRELLEILRRTFGDEHPDTLGTLNNVATELLSQRKFEEAEPYYRKVLEVRRRVLGGEHPDTLISVNNLGILFERRGEPAKAVPFYREALKTQRRLLSDEHSHTLVSVNNLGSVLREMGEFDEADRLGTEAVDTGRETLGPRHWFVGVFLSNHGRTLLAMERYSDAATRLEEAYSILSEVFGVDHGRTRGLVPHLVACYDAWEAEAPGVGHAEKAATWKTHLEAEPTSP